MDKESNFEWDPEKEKINIYKHGIDFATAAEAFTDPKRRIIIDSKHNRTEQRLFCLGKVNGRILTVRFTYRGGKIRIIGAGFWRGGKLHYEK
jgi:uncharacterized DUF497 family protein